MGSVLVDQIQPIRAFGNEIGCANLADETQERHPIKRGWLRDGCERLTIDRGRLIICRQSLMVYIVPEYPGSINLWLTVHRLWSIVRPSPQMLRSHLRDRSISQQSPPCLTLNETEGFVRIPESHFRLGGMDIHIHFLRRDFEEQRRQRITSDHQQGVIGLEQSSI